MTSPSWKQDIVRGYAQFRSDTYPPRQERYEKLGDTGQQPALLVISCCDSRVEPSDILGRQPGEIFVVRNVANIVPPWQQGGGDDNSAAAIEYAVTVLKVSAIMVMGHQACGGVQAFVDGYHKTTPDNAIARWIKTLENAKKPGKNNNMPQEMEFAGVRMSLDNLMGFPFVKDAVDKGELSLLGAYFNITKGQLMFADHQGVFSAVEP